MEATSVDKICKSPRAEATGMNNEKDEEELQLQWAAIERLPTYKRMKTSLFDDGQDENNEGISHGKKKEFKKKATDVTKLGGLERQFFIEKLIKHIENDNLRLLQKLRDRIDRVNVKLPTIEVRYKNLSVEANYKVVEGKPLPTLLNSFTSLFWYPAKVATCSSQETKISILKDVSGVIKPSRLTLLLGPPGSGKSTFLKALAGKLDKSLKVTGEISYNGYKLDEFVPQKTSAYVSQYDLHIPEMTVRETIDFSARCQGIGTKADIMMEVVRREKEAGIIPDPDVDTYMKATSVDGQRKSLQTDYIQKILGLDMCADVIVGDALTRGISGGQKKRLTTGEIIVGPTKALFMDEISTGLDTSTTFQIVVCLQQLVHITDATALVSLLQPAPEVFELFDDVMLMAEGEIVYHGPRNQALQFLEECGFKCPQRKSAADFLQEVLSKKDQAQYWYRNDIPYTYVSINQFSDIFKASFLGEKSEEERSRPYDKSSSLKSALSFSRYSLSKRELLKACMAREWLLMKRNSFVYVFKTVQIIIIAMITMTVFIRTRMAVDLMHANFLMGSLFYTIIRLMTNGIAELTLTVIRLPLFLKHKEMCLYPAWAYCIPASILKVPISLIDSLLWTSITYYVIGYSPGVQRFFYQFLVLFALHLASTSMCRFIASIFQTMEASVNAGTLILILMFLFGGFLIPQPSLPAWLKWGFWLSPMSHAEIGISLNEFLAPRWERILESNKTIGEVVLSTHGLNFNSYFYWISVGALIGFAIFFDIGFFLALSSLKSLGKSQALISKKGLSKLQAPEDCKNGTELDTKSSPDALSQQTSVSRIRERTVLPFKPLSMAFKDVQYFVDAPQGMKERGFSQKKLQLLHDITGAFRPGILTALMGVSGAGKTTLMDVLSGRKTGGTIVGDIRIDGYPKVQKTFARVSGYCEQYDIHSPQITVEESVIFSSWLRLPPETDPKTRVRFVEEVIETIELDDIKDSLVGIPGSSGLTTEQRKRLTIAVELVSNPSIIFMDEPTSGLDARAAAIVMRAVKNVVATGRTTVCTIHQPSFDIFEAFDELILMKRGGQIIYTGKLGHNSSELIKYFENISGVPKIKDNYNPATWMLEVTSSSAEGELDVDFASIYRESQLHRDAIELVGHLSEPQQGTEPLHFPSQYPQNSWVQFTACLWKQRLSYWRTPDYNLVRFMVMVISAVCFGAVFWQKGKEINTEQDLISIFGSMYIAVIFLGINNCSNVQPYVATERTVLYREKFAGMYSSWAYSFAQVAVEIPYVLLQALMYVAISYPSIGYYWSAYKVFWYFYTTFCTFLYFVYLGMLITAVSSNVEVASILAVAAYTILNLFSGFLIPGPKIPKWWGWCYWICPTAWSLNGLLTSQYGDINDEIQIFGEPKAVRTFLQEYYGFQRDQLVVVVVVLIAFPVAFAVLFAICIKKLNFQKR